MPEILAFTPEAFAHLGAHVKPEWFFEALAAGQSQAQLRRRKLPVDRALWLAIGMGLFRDRSIQEVVQHCEHALVEPLWERVPDRGLERSGWKSSRPCQRRPGVRPMGSPPASPTSRSAPARYAQEGSCSSYAPGPGARWNRDDA
ncbi:transposase domain-containing protein [Stigmatella ashevillensis]|uniref:transposase domain-containing protein n=1 Tax=Stigmatella ashevillensis TaxID=2995309 RepID=UPI00358DB486